NKVLPKPQKSGVEHIVVVMMENRSFDHFLGWLPGAEGKQGGLSYLDPANISHPTWSLSGEYQGCGFSDPDHSYEGGRIEYNNGACDGWVGDGGNDLYSTGFRSGPSPENTRAAAFPIPTIPTKAFESNTTTALVTGGCEPARTIFIPLA